jgi:hypothetical protein
MARQTYKFGSAKQFFSFTNFSGGMNSVDPEESLQDNEWRLLQNANLEFGGGAKKRHGFKKYINMEKTKPQGYFKYYGLNNIVHNLIACNGSLYKSVETVEGVPETYVKLDVKTYNQTTDTHTADSAYVFQNTRPIEAVQYGDIMFFATGTRLLEYDGTDLKEIKPYKPTATEVIKVGVNALATNPNEYIAIGSGSVLINEGIIADKAIGVVSTQTTFKAIYSKPSSMVVDIKWEYRKVGVAEWSMGVDFGTTTDWGFMPSEVGFYDIRTTIRPTGDTETLNHKIYILADYKSSAQDENKEVDYSTINTCNRIMMYYEQLILFGDSTNQNAMYVSDVYKPNYIPALNSLTFSDIKQAKVTSIVKFYEVLVVFTEDNIWSLSGTNPTNFSKKSINTSIGCIAPFSARAVGNYVFFLSREGVFKLKSLYNNDNRLNVEPIDSKIKNLITKDKNASAIQYDNQYHLVYPNEKKRFRYYHQDLEAWVVDTSEKMNFERIYTFNGEMYAQNSTTGDIYVFDETLFSDDGLMYDTIWESKSQDCGLPYHRKKPKEIYFSFQHSPDDDIKLKLYIYIDDHAVITPEEYEVSIVNNEVIYTLGGVDDTASILLGSSTSFGTWELSNSQLGAREGSKHIVRLSGTGHRVKFRVIQNEASSTGLLGYGLTAKISKPRV